MPLSTKKEDVYMDGHLKCSKKFPYAETGIM